MELPYNAEILYVIELINIGKGLIPSLTEDNLLIIKEPAPERVIPSMYEIIEQQQLNGFYSDIFALYQISSNAGFTISNNSPNNQFPLFECGVYDDYMGTLKTGISIYADKMVIKDDSFNGIEYTEPLNANLNTLTTRGFVLRTRYQHISDYQLQNGVYNITEDDLGKILDIRTTVPTQINVDGFSSFNFEVFNNSTSTVSIVAGPNITFESKAYSNTIYINKKGIAKVFNTFANQIYQISGDIIYTTITNPVNSALSNFQLNTTYPLVETGFKVQCPNISSGGLLYEKTSTGWIQYPFQVVN